MFEPKDNSFDKDSLQTPRYIFDWLDSYYDFDTDLCASDDHHYCDNYYTKENSCLDADGFLWGNCFINPPYSKTKKISISSFIDMAIDYTPAGKKFVFLIPELNGEERTRLIIKNASKIIHLSPRVSFIRPDNGLEYKGNNRGSIVVEFSKKLINTPAQHYFADLKQIKKEFEE